jgi:hypothetical protein
MTNAVRVLINELDNERIQNSNIRTNINIAISHVAQLINMAQEPWYQVVWEISLEPAPHFTGAPWVDLSIPAAFVVGAANTGQRNPQQTPGLLAGNLVPANLLWEIKLLIGAKDGSQIAVPNVWVGNCTRLSMNEIMNLQTHFNTQYRQNIAWVHSGNAIYFHIGNQIGTGLDFEAPGQLALIGTRTPLLDNMEGEQTATTSWNQLLDLPDRHCRLVLLLAQKMCLGQLNKTEPPSLDNEVAQLSSQITQNVIQELQFEQGKRSKVDQGFQTR